MESVIDIRRSWRCLEMSHPPISSFWCSLPLYFTFRWTWWTELSVIDLCWNCTCKCLEPSQNLQSWPHGPVLCRSAGSSELRCPWKKTHIHSISSRWALAWLDGALWSMGMPCTSDTGMLSILTASFVCHSFSFHIFSYINITLRERLQMLPCWIWSSASLLSCPRQAGKMCSFIRVTRFKCSTVHSGRVGLRRKLIFALHLFIFS